MGVIQGGDGAGFACEALTEFLRRDFDCHAAVEAGIGGAEDASHATVPERRLDAVRAEHGGDREGIVGVDGRWGIVEGAGGVGGRQHVGDLLAQGGIGGGQESRTVGGTLFDFGEEPLKLLPSLGCQGCLIRHDRTYGPLPRRRRARSGFPLVE